MQTYEIKIEDVVKGKITIPQIIVDNWDKRSFELEGNVKFKVIKDGEDVTDDYVVKPTRPGQTGSCGFKGDGTITFTNVEVSVNKRPFSRDFKENGTKTQSRMKSIPKVIIYTGVLSRMAGGLFYSVSSLAKAIDNLDCDVTLCGFKDENEEDIANYEGINLKIYNTYGPLKNHALSNDVLQVFSSEEPDIIHQQGIWSFESLYTLKYKKTHPSCKVVISPRGMLDPWIVRRSPMKKWIVRKWFEEKNLSEADCLYALCRSEHDSMRQFGLKNPIAIIPNGTDIPDWKRDYDSLKKKSVKEIVFISRLHPKKGVIEMIQAYEQVKRQTPELAKKWKIKIAGWGDEDYINSIRNAIQNYNLEDDIKLLGSVYGKEKEELLKEADAFILPTYSEGLPMAVLEAWAYGLPVITTDFANLPEGFENGAAFRIENEVSKMAIGLTEFFSKSNEEIISYGKNGYSLAKSSFSWEVVGEKTLALYEWILGKAEKPEFVHLYNENNNDGTLKSKG